MRKQLVAIAILLTANSALAEQSRVVPTPEDYVEHLGGDAKIVPPGELKLAGRRVYCGMRPAVIDNKLNDYSSHKPGFIILNMNRLGRLSETLKLWAYNHECAHEFRGPNEVTADCFSVQRGRRQGWLTQEGMEEICEFIRSWKGNAVYMPGPQRCEYMRQCFAERKVH